MTFKSETHKRSNFIVFLFPYSHRSHGVHLLWLYYKALCQCNPDEVIFIGSEEYFADPSSYASSYIKDIDDFSQFYCEFSMPDANAVNQSTKFIIPRHVFKHLECSMSKENVFKSLLTRRNESLEKCLDAIFQDILAKRSIDGVITWCNCPSLDHVAAFHGLSVIHNELGPFRRPEYLFTAYFDFKGVNGDTEAVDRFSRFMKSSRNVEHLLLNASDLVKMFQVRPIQSAEVDKKNFCIGIPTQLEDDSNIIAYSNGYDNKSLLKFIFDKYNSNEVLVRKHPAGFAEYPGVKNIDASASAAQFLDRCEKIITINSSVGLEALLLDKEVEVAGDCPYKFIARKLGGEGGLDGEMRQVALNFIMFGYLIPYELLFVFDYYKWRLTDPGEEEIFLFHYNYYRELRNALDEICSLIHVRNKAISINHLTNQCHRLGRIIADDRVIINQQRDVIDQQKKSLDGITNSISWKITRPLRWFRAKIPGCERI